MQFCPSEIFPKASFWIRSSKSFCQMLFFTKCQTFTNAQYLNSTLNKPFAKVQLTLISGVVLKGVGLTSKLECCLLCCFLPKLVPKSSWNQFWWASSRRVSFKFCFLEWGEGGEAIGLFGGTGGFGALGGGLLILILGLYEFLKTKFILVILTNWQVSPTQCGNFRIFLLLRFYMKSILKNLGVQKMPFLQFLRLSILLMW